MITIVYFLLLGLVWWCYIGYFIFLFVFTRRTSVLSPENDLLDNSSPVISLIVPTYNEHALIEEKIKNICSLSYKYFTAYFVDASDDGTAECIEGFIADEENMHLIRIPKPGRSGQINEALKEISAGIVVISDVDAIMEPDSLQKVAGYFKDKVGIVGACIEPVKGYGPDQVFWQTQNMMRSLESGYRHTPVASGACFAFRREVLDFIPENVWAEDIYIPFYANTAGYESVVAETVQVSEVRGPENFGALLSLKIRKGQDNLKELLRFMPKVFTMSWKWRVVFVTRFLQIAGIALGIIPFICLFFLQSLNIIAGTVVFLGVSFLIQQYITRRVSNHCSSFSLFDVIASVSITTLSVICAVFMYIVRGGRVRYVRVVK